MLESEFEDKHFANTQDIDEDFKLLHEIENAEHRYWLSDYALGRVRKNQNYIILITGQVGSGKSYSGLALAEDIDPYFNIDRVIFHPKEFIQLLDMGLPKGSVVLWEEVGVTLSSRDWFKEQNKIISSLFETFRRHNLILIMTVPNVQFIDSRIRSMIHGYGEMLDPTYTGGEFGWMKYFHVIVNLRNGKIMHRYPRVRDEDGKTHVIQGNRRDSGNMFFDLPSNEILEPYEKKKFEFVKWQQESGLSKFNPKEKIETLEIGDIIRIITSNPRKHKIPSKKEKEGDGDKKESLTTIIEHNWVLFKLEYPHMKLKKNDIASAVRFVLNSFDYKFKQGDKEIRDEELPTIYELQQIFGENHKAIANSLNTTEYMLKKKLKEWEENGMLSTYEESLEVVEEVEGYAKDKRKQDGNNNDVEKSDDG